MRRARSWCCSEPRARFRPCSTRPRSTRSSRSSRTSRRRCGSWMPPTAEPGERLTLSLPARIDILEPCRRAVRDFLAPHGLGPQAIYKTELVLEEALVNIISYAYADPRGHTIDLSVEVEP